MIITLTANAAIDKTLTVPNFVTGFRHRASQSLTLPGGKGVNVARVLKTIGQPVDRQRARRRAHRPADRRGALARGHPQRLRAHRRGVANLHRGHRPDQHEPDRDQRVGPGGHRAGAPGLPRQDRVPGQGRPLRRSSAGRCRARCPTTSMPRSCGASTGRAATPSSTAPATPCGTACAPTPTSSPPTCARPRISWATSSTTSRTSSRPPTSSVSWAPTTSSSRRPTAATRGCATAVACASTTRASRSSRAWSARSGSGDAFLAGFVAGHFRTSDPGDCLRYGLACGAANTQHYGAGVLDPDEVDALLATTTVDEIRVVADRLSSGPAGAPLTTATRLLNRRAPRW